MIPYVISKGNVRKKTRVINYSFDCEDHGLHATKSSQMYLSTSAPLAGPAAGARRKVLATRYRHLCMEPEEQHRSTRKETTGSATNS